MKHNSLLYGILDLMMGFNLFYTAVERCNSNILMLLLCFTYVYIRVYLFYLYMNGTIHTKNKDKDSLAITVNKIVRINIIKRLHLMLSAIVVVLVNVKFLIGVL